MSDRKMEERLASYRQGKPHREESKLAAR